MPDDFPILEAAFDPSPIRQPESAETFECIWCEVEPVKLEEADFAWVDLAGPFVVTHCECEP
jgi:hypothetical protein